VPPLFRSLFWHWSRHHDSRLAFLHNGFRPGLADHPSQLKNVIESPTPKPFVGIVFRNIVVANQQIRGIRNSHLESNPRILRPNNGVNLQHRNHNLRQGRLLHLHLETKIFIERPQTTVGGHKMHIFTANIPTFHARYRRYVPITNEFHEFY
jgi:hypothetical protein